MDLDGERDLFWIAREGLKAPLPENWKPCKTTDTEEIYYFNFATGQSTWDHPCDEFYRNLYEEHKNKRHTKDVQETDEKKKKVKEDVAELLGRKSGSKKKKAVETKAHDAEFEEKRERLNQDHCENLHKIQTTHDNELEALRKKLKAQLEDVQDAEEMKLKQLKREFDKRKHDLEDQYDREENALQRSRKDQLKRLETETENALSNKKLDLDHEFKSEIDKLRLKHETKQREIELDFQLEAKQLEDKVTLTFGEKKETAQLAIELKKLASALEKLDRLEEELAYDTGSFSEGFSREVDDRFRGNEFHSVYQVPQLQQDQWLKINAGCIRITLASACVAPMSSASHNNQVYQQKISRWARGREKVQHAATNHATWLSGLCEELKEYEAKYTRVDGEEDNNGAQFQHLEAD
ncbi:Viral Atype inclusion protein [Phytophthora megakarya]|uniref:Viral Atype inclusion protein n=1 Tax=Phytophthora megakarya TaxID=4795 RepID=A0A225WYY4_9STRA|nr:Viral Atype inclusion protein [Phytophthora megakarya]